MSIAVAVIGAAGRMGREVCQAVESADDLRLVGRFDIGDELGNLGGADVAVEFSVPAASLDNVLHAVRRGVHAVVGTTGWTDEGLEKVRWALETSPGTGVLIAPNFSHFLDVPRTDNMARKCGRHSRLEGELRHCSMTVIVGSIVRPKVTEPATC